jgi:hypothetical protein
MHRRGVFLAALLVAGGAAALTLTVSRVGGHESATRPSKEPSVTINALATTPEWMLTLASRKARELTKSAPTTGRIEKRRLTYEVRLHGEFTWLACDPCPRNGPLPVAIQDSVLFRVDPASRRVVMASGPSSLLR